MISFDELMLGVRGTDYIPPERLLAVDPGETTGWAYFENGILRSSGQIAHRDLGIMSTKIQELIGDILPTHVVAEDYKVYRSKAKSHSWSGLYTPKLLGAIEFICGMSNIPLTLQMASSKQFCTDAKLKIWGYYCKGNPHTNDAIRHGCYFLLFHKRRRKKDEAF